jgi:hypothetical protein
VLLTDELGKASRSHPPRKRRLQRFGRVLRQVHCLFFAAQGMLQVGYRGA